ncbi:MAG: hypothetical protein H6765_03705 [Candidatus Peribacteria bacterium]|nr:MAG: hypothetical protein H6765_03705 [Candidatus Peribacteria bacterium]
MKSQYHQYLSSLLPYCSPQATIVCDDVISYAEKAQPLTSFLQQQHISYDIIPLADADGVLLIDLGKNRNLSL